MDRSPYAAPNAKVDDAAPTPSLVRTKIGLVGFLIPLVTLLGFVLWALPRREGVVAPIAIGLALGAALAALPIHFIRARKPGLWPWWWDACLYSLGALFLVSAGIGKFFPAAIALVAVVFVYGAGLIGILIVEARHRVEVYPKAPFRSGLVFVEKRSTTNSDAG